MDTKPNSPKCWEITGCRRQDVCKVLKVGLVDKPCWDVVAGFDDYRTALNVCSDCIVSVLCRKHSNDVKGVEGLQESKAGDSAPHSCPACR